LSSLPGIDDVALTTNGVLLAKYATELRAAGLKRVTVSLDSLDPAVFQLMNGGMGEIADVLAGIDAAVRAGLTPIKINTVVQKGVNDHTLLDLLAHFRGTPVIVRMIEYMDVGNRNDWSADLVLPSAQLVDQIRARWPIAPRDPNYRGEVAERYAYDDGAGELGFISSISQPFCGDCARGRLSSAGEFFTCLFAQKGFDLRGPLRGGASDAELETLWREVWAGRQDRYSELRVLQRATPANKVEMFHIGG
jgi:cyclic pyranopterin phosphate synthase